jgi:hypothetical protein
MATGYELDDEGEIPDKGKVFLFSTASRPALGAIQPLNQWAMGPISPGVKHEAHQSPLSSAEVKKCRDISSQHTPLFHVILYTNFLYV